jgi:DNA-nicking Smr family endonuclease
MPGKSVKYRPFRGLSSLSPKAKNPGSGFSDVMAREGTVPLREGTRRIAPERKSRPRAPASSAPSFEVTRDEDWLEGYRRDLSADMRRRLHGTPTATLDLHRLDTETARHRVGSFLARERANGHEVVLVVVGRGRHSPGGQGVLRTEIGDWLSTHPIASSVLAFRTAPRNLGGSGGVVVLLAQASRRKKRS